MMSRSRLTPKDYGPDSGGRKKGTRIVKKILVGCRSRRLDEPIPDPHFRGVDVQHSKPHTHSWTIYVRPYENEDITLWIKKVQFKLYPDYPDHLRSCSGKKFEVSETGWGEFEVEVKLSFPDPIEQEISIRTAVRLFKKPGSDDLFINELPDGTLVAERYDELVFTEPSAMMVDCLHAGLEKNYERGYRPDKNYEQIHKEKLQQLKNVRKTVRDEVELLRKRFEEYREPFNHLCSILNESPSNVSTEESSKSPSKKSKGANFSSRASSLSYDADNELGNQ